MLVIVGLDLRGVVLGGCGWRGCSLVFRVEFGFGFGLRLGWLVIVVCGRLACVMCWCCTGRWLFGFSVFDLSTCLCCCGVGCCLVVILLVYCAGVGLRLIWVVGFRVACVGLFLGLGVCAKALVCL